MSAHTVALDAEAYEALKRLKKPDETFSEVVKRISTRHRPLADFAGLWKDLPRRERRQLEASYRLVREADQRRAKKLDELWR